MEKDDQLNKTLKNHIWLSVSEAAKFSGVQTKTIRRAIQAKTVKFKIVKNRYSIECDSLIIYLNLKKKLRNKLKNYGIGQYVEKWNKSQNPPFNKGG